MALKKKKKLSILHGLSALVSVHHVCAVLTEATRGHWIPGTGDSDTCENGMAGHGKLESWKNSQCF